MRFFSRVDLEMQSSRCSVMLSMRALFVIYHSFIFSSFLFSLAYRVHTFLLFIFIIYYAPLGNADTFNFRTGKQMLTLAYYC